MDWASASCWMGRRVLVTGASGFLGGAVYQLLAELGADVHGTGLHHPVPPLGHSHQAQLPEDVGLIAAIEPEVIFHLAGPVDVSRDPAKYEVLRHGILDATDAVARAALQLDARLVYVGTCEEYGDGQAPFREDHAPRPVSAYSALKLAAGQWVLCLNRTAGLKAGVVRPFRTYGPGDRHSVVAAVCRAALKAEPLPMTDGAQIREWNDVDSMALAIVAAGAHPDAVGQVLNLGGGPQASVAEVARKIFALAEADPALLELGTLPRRSGEVDHFWGDHRRAEALWGPLPHMALDDGLAEALDWMDSIGLDPEAS